MAISGEGRAWFAEGLVCWLEGSSVGWTGVRQLFAQLGSASGKGRDSISWLAYTSLNRPFEVGTLRRRATRPSKRVMPPTVLLRNTFRETSSLSYR